MWLNELNKAEAVELVIPMEKWKWFGSPGHFICGDKCRFHLCTQIGDYLISTIGEYWPDSAVRKIKAKIRGIKVEGRGDEYDINYFNQFGFEEIGLGRLYETMVFHTTGEVCQRPTCNCKMPSIIPRELDFDGYNTGGDATAGHLAMCYKVASNPTQYKKEEENVDN